MLKINIHFYMAPSNRLSAVIFVNENCDPVDN